MKKIFYLLILILFSPAYVNAFGLGDVVVGTALNEPLEGRIELLSASPDELDSLAVTLADGETFTKAGIDRPFILSKLRFDLVRSTDSRPDYIRVSSQLPIQEPFLNFLIEVSWINGRILREYTILLDPPSYDFRSKINREESQQTIIEYDDSTEISTYKKPNEDEEIKSYTPRTNYTGKDYGPTVRQDTLSEIAYKTRPDRSISLDQMMMAIFRANPQAFINQNINGLKGGYVLQIPDENVIREIDLREAKAAVRSQHAVWSGAGFEEEGPVVEESEIASDAAEVDVDEDKAVESTNTDSYNPELRLVAPSDDTEESQETGVNKPTKSNDLLLAEETIETLTQENFELKARLKELESLVEKLQPLLSLKDDELAAYQVQLSNEADEKVISTEEEAAFEEATEEEAAFEETNEEGITGESTYESQVKRDEELVQTYLGPFAPIIDKVKDLVLGKVGLAILGILILLLVFLRLRRAPVETVELEPIDDAELAEIDKEVSGLMDSAAATQTEESEDETVIAPVKESVVEEEGFDEEVEAEFSMDEVNAYIAFEQYDDAESAIRNALSVNSDNQELHMKLLEVFYNSSNENSFKEEAGFIKSKFGAKGEEWDRVLSMWNEMTNSILSFNDDGSEDETIMVGTPDDGSEDKTTLVGTPDDLEINIEVPSDEISDSNIETEDDDFEIDLSTTEDDDSNVTNTIIDSSEMLEKTEFDLDIDNIDANESDESTITSKDDSDGSDDQEIEIDLDLDLAEDSGDTSVSVNENVEDTHAAFVEKVAESEDLSTEDVVATKLDLAIAYVEVSDKENAKTILNEVLEEGDESQREQAKKLLDQI